MEIAKTITEAREIRAGLGCVGFVPTMGALHAGHISLIHRADELCDSVAVSIFVNPTQFGESEDFNRYPRPIDDDLDICESLGVDMVFFPSVEEMYPGDEFDVEVNVPDLASILEGEFRSGHFSGVCRVVMKLFNIVGPNVALFGQKDYQQLAVIQAMARGMCMPIEVVGCQTIRESDGLAISSRNGYLSGDDREKAVCLSKALRLGEEMIRDGETDPVVVEGAMAGVIETHGGVVDYAVVRHRYTLGAMDSVSLQPGGVVCLVAARIGGVRLIDNVEVV